VVLTCRSVDRIFLQGYVPKLKSVGLVCRFSRWQRGFFVPSSAAFGKIGDAYVAKVHKFAADYDIPVVYFDKGKEKPVKELVAPPLHRGGSQRGWGGSGGAAWVSLRRKPRSGGHGRPSAKSTLAIRTWTHRGDRGAGCEPNGVRHRRTPVNPTDDPPARSRRAIRPGVSSLPDPTFRKDPLAGWLRNWRSPGRWPGCRMGAEPLHGFRVSPCTLRPGC
jgi:hypothetical protein